MENTQNTTDLATLEISLQEKLEQFKKAEEAGRPQAELNLLYQHLKDLRQKIDLSKPEFRHITESF
jgi:hypothetical protein